MKYVAVLALSLLGLVEFVLRVLSVPLTFFASVECLEERLFLENFCFDLAKRVVQS